MKEKLLEFKDNLFKKFMNKISQSLDGNTHNPSTIRIQSYLVLLPIILMVIMFMGLEIFNFITHFQHGQMYRISNEIIVVFGMVLSHHLGILFSRNKSQSIAEIKGDKEVSIESSKDTVIVTTENNPESTDEPK